MLAYKLKGTVDQAGNLVLHESVKMNPGEVEVIVLQPVDEEKSSPIHSSDNLNPVKPKREVKCSVPILKEWLEMTEPAPVDFDPDQVKWEYLKEKYNL